MDTSSIPKQEYGSDLVVDLLKQHRIEYVAANIGSTFRGLWDSLVNYGGDEQPKCISVCHEEIAVAIAHGYAKAAGKPMAALVHDTVGLQHATMAIYNAWCDRVPILVLGAVGPLDASKRRPWIDWIHTALVPNELVRNYVKWDDFAFSVSSIPQSFARAYSAAVTDPTAPVFLCLDTANLEERIGTIRSSMERSPAPSFPHIDSSSLETIAKSLLEAENSFIVAGTVGRNRDSVEHLVELAEAIGARVYDTMDRFSFPNTSPLDVSDRTVLGKADVILALDAPRLEFVLSDIDKRTREWKPITRPGAKVFKIGLDDLLAKSWPLDYQGLVRSESSILADTSLAIPKLTEACKRIAGSNTTFRKAIEERKERARRDHHETKERWLAEAKKQWNDVPISLPRLALEVWETVKGKRWIIANGHLEGWVRKLWSWEEPGCFLGDSGGAGLGYGLPASIGAALSQMNSQRVVIDFQADGDFLFTPSALWTAAHYKVPLLIVMFNNRLYFNDAEHNKLVAQARGRNADLAYRNGGAITDPDVDFAQLARSQGVRGVGPIKKPDEIAAALQDALNVVEQERKPALVDVVTRAR